VSWARGGFAGVTLFFTLSGFLITSLLLAEREHTGGVALTRFWARRARRLIPASMLALVLAGVVVVLEVPGAQRPDIVNDLRASLLNVANWRFVREGVAYGDFNVVPSPVQHYWTLAIEEQFYLLYPLLAAVALRKRMAGLATALGVITVVSVIRQITIADRYAVYFGTDTRAAELAIGGLLAIAYVRIDDLRNAPRAAVDALGLAALGALAVIVARVPLDTPALFEGSLALVAVVSAALIVAAVQHGRLSRWLAVGPLVAFGRISYGTYLVHFPLFVLVDGERTGLDGWPLLSVRLIVTLLAGMASYHLVEVPIRYGRRLKGRAAPIALLSAYVVLLGASFPLSASGRHDLPDVHAPGATARAPRVLVLGDSSAGALGEGLRVWGAGNDRLVVDTLYKVGCGTLPGADFLAREGYVYTPEGCDTLWTDGVARARQIDADAIVVFMGSSQLADWRYEGQPGRHHLGEPRLDADYQRALDDTLATLEEVGVPVLWATVPVPAWDLDLFAESLGTALPGEGPVTLNNPGRTARLNELDAAVIAGHPLVEHWPYAEQLQGIDGTVPTSIRPDGLHLSVDGVATIADRWLFTALDQAFDAVVGRGPARLRPPGRQAFFVDHPAS
jgi:peptidoglycan/LPS O-acetylase OafA/YrhL